MNKLTPAVKSRDVEIQRKYFLWLCGLVDVNESDEDTPNRELCWWLHQKEFVSILPNDDNRAVDGTKLRETFADNFLKEDCPCLGGTCTMLEMLIALAVHMDYLISDGPNDNRVPKCFWEMVDNLGLKLFRVGDPDFKDKIYENDQALDMFINRKYLRSGKGGLFPLKFRGTLDQRNTEIWYQMMNYIEEKLE